MQKHKIILGLASVLAMGAVNAHEAGSFIVRGGGIFVSANSDSVTKTPINVNLDVGDNAQLGLTGTYMFTDNFGIELLGATPFSHKISATVPALKLGLGDVVKLKQLPPSLYAQYYFLDQDSGSRPYVGAGINYTRFFSAKPMVSAITDLDVKKHSFSPILNAGIDIKLTDNVYLNTAMWYTKIKTTAKFKALGASHEVKVKLDPLVFFTGLAYRF
ncbi:outer membrane protein W precursor [Aggregatibacter actinomycetemcomitans serotype e str. SC1083]|uniref:Outer membrane protein W n=3 Tax=Aggregatibacter actinomycetemcomitans TaxID=714 RepID=G4ABH0_AGGAC|nr:OmpW family protein [Aggregatibacter actinomycetemcomitans]EGY32323.1 outer membrane protein W precursor [Aggregatibacter actinomycetemcomitans serotype e str. SC1083]KYK73713.1 membrane protein [Aggregatibacter actinomycetemcomitans serotype e str. SA3096]KYK77253.1 membrane protein [Aggregatibacter actinomycetemcomitans serotype e str. SC936]MBN6070883.1 OmpW family protein [Aggregatibacter actinomycetemcomitans]TYB06040.1 OmpW family protein [Aggregatibacter actinomycetemcomitans]